MSAAEIIEQIKALSPEERQAVIAFAKSIENHEATARDTVRYADNETFDAVAERIFDRHAPLFRKLAE